MSLVIRYDAGRQVLASLGDPPNGLLVSMRDGDGRVRFAISGTWQPPTERVADGVVAIPSIHEDPEPIDTDAAVSGCVSRKEATGLWMAACGTVREYAAALMHDGDTDAVLAAVAFAAEVRDELVEAGYLEVVE